MTEGELSRLGPQVEVDAIFAALRNQPGIWQVEILWHPTEDQLADSLLTIRPQIIHFIGEPSFVENPSDRQPELAFTITKPGDQPHYLTVPALEKILFDMQDRPRLFILNGCWTNSMATPESFDKLGSKAVITNQAKVYGAPAITFTKNFYGTLAETSDVAKAVWEARVALWKIRGEDFYDWGIPVLTLYDGPDAIIHSLKTVSKKAETLIRKGDFGRPARHFDRLRQSRQLWNCVDIEQGRKNIVLFCGYPSTGKSALLRNCMLTWKLRGHPAVLFDAKKAPVRDRSNMQIETVLDYICEALQTEIVGAPQIRRELTELRTIVQKISYDEKKSSENPDPYSAPCALFISLLEKATRIKPLMLAFDSISSLFPEDPHGLRSIGGDLSTRLKKYIFEPIARGDAGATYLVIAAIIFGEYNEVEELLNWREEQWDDWVEHVHLGMFEGSDARPLGHEYGARRGWFDKVDREVHDENGNGRMADWIRKIEASGDFNGRWFPFELCQLADKFRPSPAEG